MGQQFIKFDHKTLLFNNWINSDLIYLNDILDENGEISHNFILTRLNNISNWITEFTIMKLEAQMSLYRSPDINKSS
jgi:hypothetical protein